MGCGTCILAVMNRLQMNLQCCFKCMKNGRSGVFSEWGLFGESCCGVLPGSVQNHEQSVPPFFFIFIFLSLCEECAAMHLHSKQRLQECLHPSHTRL